MTDTKVAVVILNYNGKPFLEKFLHRILQYSAPYPVIVADNGSTDGSLNFLEHQFPQVRIISNGGNFGYARGYNLALKHIVADYYVLLNSDVEVTEGWITPVLALMEKNRSVAACQPKILDYKTRHLFEYAGASGGFIDKYGYPFCRGRLFNSIEEDHNQFNDATEVFWATGACLFVRSAAFWQVGGLDGDYFAHMEEIDLCWRLQNLGYQVYVEPASAIYHVGGGTLNKLSSQKTFLNFRNNLITYTKNNSPQHLFLKVVYRLILDGVAAFKFLFDGQPKHFFAVLKAHFYYYSWLGKTLKKRKEMKAKPGFRFNTRHIYNGNIVIEHFLKKKKKFNELHQGFLSDYQEA